MDQFRAFFITLFSGSLGLKLILISILQKTLRLQVSLALISINNKPSEKLWSNHYASFKAHRELEKQ